MEPLSPLQEGLQRESHPSAKLPGPPWPVTGNGGSSQEENKNHKKKKIFQCLFIILSGLFKMNSIYGNEPLNEAIYNRYIGSAWH